MATCHVCGPIPDDSDVDEHMTSRSHRSMLEYKRELQETIYTPPSPSAG